VKPFALCAFFARFSSRSLRTPLASLQEEEEETEKSLALSALERQPPFSSIVSLRTPLASLEQEEEEEEEHGRFWVAACVLRVKRTGRRKVRGLGMLQRTNLH